jgi:hypothetical protein
MDDEVPILDEENYSTWRIEMRVYLKTMGETIWKEAIGGSVPLKNKSKFVAQREGKKNDALALKTILSGLSSPIKESMGQCTSAKDLWLKLEETYQSKKEKEDIEDHSIKIIKGKESPKTLECIISKCDLENFQMKTKNQVMMLAQMKILKTFQIKEKNHVIMLAKRKILKILQIKVKNLQRLLIAMIQNVMMLNFSQVKKMI